MIVFLERPTGLLGILIASVVGGLEMVGHPGSKALAGLIFGLIGSLAATGSVHAQQTMNPPGFDPYSAPYRAYAFPGAGDNPAITNSQMSGRDLTTINNFGRLAGLDDGLSGDDGLNPFPNGGRYRRYDSSYRMYDRSLGREFNPNGKTDASYFGDRQRKEELRIKLMRETDPKKVAEIERQIEKIADRSDRPSDDINEAYRSTRRNGGSFADASAVGLSSRRSAGNAAAGPSPGSATPARLNAPGQPSAVVDAKASASFAPSPSSVLERSRRMSQPASLPPAAPR